MNMLLNIIFYGYTAAKIIGNTETRSVLLTEFKWQNIYFTFLTIL